MRTTGVSNNVFQSFYKNREQLKKNVEQMQMNKVPDKKKEHKALIASAAVICSLAPVVALNIKKGRGNMLVDAFKSNTAGIKDKFKAVYDLFEIDNFKEVLGATAGAIAGGTLSGIALEKNPDNRKAKLKEGTFEFLNNMTPTTLVAATQLFSNKTGKLKSPAAKAASIAASVAGGMFIANKTSNKLNEKVFDKKEAQKTERKFKLMDCLVHLDDIITLLVIAKVPFAKMVQLDKILPALYAKSGYEAGIAKDERKLH